MPVGSQSTEEVDQNYVPMSANSPSHHHSGSLPEPMHETNYVPMTPSTMEFSSLGKQVPPPAHMGFRSSPKTPPRRPMVSDCQPPPVDRNLKPDRKGERRKGVHACVAVAWFTFCEFVKVLLLSWCVLKFVVALKVLQFARYSLMQQLTTLRLTLSCYSQCWLMYIKPSVQNCIISNHSQSSVCLHHTLLIINVYMYTICIHIYICIFY